MHLLLGIFLEEKILIFIQMLFCRNTFLSLSLTLSVFSMMVIEETLNIQLNELTYLYYISSFVDHWTFSFQNSLHFF